MELPGQAPTTTGDLHLQVASPCIDAGNNHFNLEPTDLDGEERIQNKFIDLGAYEVDDALVPDHISDPAVHKVTGFGSRGSSGGCYIMTLSF